MLAILKNRMNSSFSLKIILVNSNYDSNRPVQNNYSKDDLCHSFCLYPSSMVHESRLELWKNKPKNLVTHPLTIQLMCPAAVCTNIWNVSKFMHWISLAWGRGVGTLSPWAYIISTDLYNIIEHGNESKWQWVQYMFIPISSVSCAVAGCHSVHSIFKIVLQ